MGQRNRISNVLYRDVDRTGKRVAFSVHGLRERWRCVSHTVHNRLIPRWKAFLLSRDDNGPIHK